MKQFPTPFATAQDDTPVNEHPTKITEVKPRLLNLGCWYLVFLGSAIVYYTTYAGQIFFTIFWGYAG